MLVLTRKKDQTIIIGDNVEITVLDIKGDQIRIGIKAPKEISILRKEVYQAVKAENEIAFINKGLNIDSLKKILKESVK